VGEQLIITIITSITSIFVALITAGVFRKIMDKKKDENSKKKLIKQIEKDELIHFTLREVRRKYNADRLYLIQFHNGGSFYTNSPMQKASVTYERCSDGLERVSEKLQNIFVSHYTWFIKHSIDKQMFYLNCEDIEDVTTKALLRKFGTQSTASLPIYDNNNQLISIMVLDWVFSEIGEHYIDNDNFNQHFIEEFILDVDSVKNLL